MSQARKVASHTRIKKNSSISEKEILRINDIITTTGTNRMQLHRWRTEPDFPKPIRLSERTIGWWKDEFFDWLESRRVS